MENNTKLSSWKEISDYLKIRVRTAQRWEKDLNLPIHRVSGSPGTYVYAYKEELDRWLEERDEVEKKDEKGRSKISTRINKKRIAIISIFFITLISLTILFFPFNSFNGKHFAAQFKIEGKQLIIGDEKGKEIWRYDLESEPESHEYQRKESSYNSSDHRNIDYVDIDNDNNLDVLFTLHTADHIHESVMCFNHRGALQWAEKPGRNIKFGSHMISPDFDVRFVKPIDLDADGSLEIVIISAHKLFFPCRVQILNPAGKLIGDYWNSGHISCVQYKDLDNDGIKEIIWGGTNNGYKKACLGVLDIRKISGSSPQSKDTKYNSKELDVGTEKCYILIPNDEISSLRGLPDSVCIIDFLEDDRFIAWTSFSRIGYIFDFRLNPVDLYLGDQFLKKFKEMNRQNITSLPLSFYQQKTLLKQIVYWDGKKWTNVPTVTESWQK